MMQLRGRIQKLWDTFGPQAVKFGIVGGIGTGTAYVLLYVLVQYFGVYYIYASWISMIIGQLISFTGYRWWAFVLKTQRMMYSTRFQFVIHWAIWGMGFCIATGILYSLTEYLHLWYMFSQVFATIVSATCNFLSHKYFTYRPANWKLIEGTHRIVMMKNGSIRWIPPKGHMKKQAREFNGWIRKQKQILKQDSTTLHLQSATNQFLTASERSLENKIGQEEKEKQET